jgi:hypothetical protein
MGISNERDAIHDELDADNGQMTKNWPGIIDKLTLNLRIFQVSYLSLSGRCVIQFHVSRDAPQAVPRAWAVLLRVLPLVRRDLRVL